MNDVEVILISGRYRTLVTQLSNLIFKNLKVGRTIYGKHRTIMFKEILNENIPLHFYLGLETKYSNTLEVTGNAYNETSTWNEEIPYIEIIIETNDDSKNYSNIIFRLANILRHEIEHLTQSGYNTISHHHLPDDQYEREHVNEKEYLLLPKEVTAGVRGIYSQSCKMKKPFDVMLNEYLLETYLLKSEIEEVTSVYLKKAKELNLWKNMM
tara:strand:- start:196 stop:828 length:633 start_codon:yes stop_codon:yes gene_type:complete